MLFREAETTISWAFLVVLVAALAAERRVRRWRSPKFAVRSGPRRPRNLVHLWFSVLLVPSRSCCQINNLNIHVLEHQADIQSVGVSAMFWLEMGSALVPRATADSPPSHVPLQRTVSTRSIATTGDVFRSVANVRPLSTYVG